MNLGDPMNTKQKFSLIIGGALIVMAFAAWLFYGGEIFTKTAVLIEKPDELFPDQKVLEWEDKFVLGLDYTLGFNFLVALLTTIFFFIFKNKKENA